MKPLKEASTGNVTMSTVSSRDTRHMTTHVVSMPAEWKSPGSGARSQASQE